MAAEGGVMLWGVLGSLLLLLTFGPSAVYLPLYLLCFIGGGLAVLLLFGKTVSETHLEKCEHSFLPTTQTGILKTLEEMKVGSRPVKIDRRLTGSSFIDEPLQQVLQFALRDYIQYWYYPLSEDELSSWRYGRQCRTPWWSYLHGPKRWTGSRTSPRGWWTTSPLTCACSAKPRSVSARRRTPNNVTTPRSCWAHSSRWRWRWRGRSVETWCALLPKTRKASSGTSVRCCCTCCCHQGLSQQEHEILHQGNSGQGVLLPLINQLSDPDYINQFVIWMVSE
ncbi:hypothetical protein AAFF_G00441690 [Aldrovandia affinis]|uniref:PXA domain-containing protein n=1 Tax=Aldrovandia affinis TaxID=143900 RepID=A0AAD7WHZ4_9TELE|nr:hypothetical protein AAFF_G00441690 [Aldrovandia affinis]